MQRDATRCDAISPGRNLLKSCGFKFKRAVTYFTRYNMISRGNYVDPCNTVDDFSISNSNLEGVLPQPILIQSQKSQDCINGRLLLC